MKIKHKFDLSTKKMYKNSNSKHNYIQVNLKAYINNIKCCFF